MNVISRYLAVAALMTLGCSDNAMSGIEVLCEQSHDEFRTPLAIRLLHSRTDQVIAELESGGADAAQACEEAVRILGFNTGFVSATALIWSQILHEDEEDPAARQAIESADQELFETSSGFLIAVQVNCRTQRWTTAAETLRSLQSMVREALQDRVTWCQDNGHLSQ